MTTNLFIQAITKFLLGFVLVGLVIFLPAGTLSFFNGWLLLGVLFIPMFLAGIIMMVKNPELLKKRLNAKEKLEEQSLVVKLSGLMFLSGFIIAGLDFRFGWYTLPKVTVIIATVVFLIAYILYAFYPSVFTFTNLNLLPRIYSYQLVKSSLNATASPSVAV